MAERLLERYPQLHEDASTFDESAWEVLVGSAVRSAYEATLFREPTQHELRQLSASFREFLTFYRGNSEQAEDLMKIGHTPAEARWNRPPLAAMTMMISVIMNTDEFLTKE